MKLQLQVSKQDFYKKYYQSINGILKLTNKELAILTLLSNKKLEGITDKDLFSSKSRLELSQILGITKFNLNNYIKSMKDRSILVKTNKVMTINPAIYKDINSLESLDFIFKFIIYENDKL